MQAERILGNRMTLGDTGPGPCHSACSCRFRSRYKPPATGIGRKSAGPEGGGPRGAAVERPRDRRAGPCRQRQDDHAARGEGASRRAEDTGPGAVGRCRPGSRQGGRDPHADAAVLPDPLRRPLGPGAAGPWPGGVWAGGSGGGRGRDDRQRSHGGAAARRARWMWRGSHWWATSNS